MRSYNNIFLWLLIFISLMANAAPPAWQIVPNESHLQFTAIQNNAPVSGEFKSFHGTIMFDPTQLTSSEVNIVVDMNSVDVAYAEVTNTLKTPDWFNIQAFPTATFKANQFIKTGENTYQAMGNLTLRDKTQPIVLNFVLNEYTPSKAHVEGATTIKRTFFGIGQGEWSSTDEIADEVKISFTLSVKK